MKGRDEGAMAGGESGRSRIAPENEDGVVETARLDQELDFPFLVLKHVRQDSLGFLRR